ncbi:MAG: SsrA-binding protein [Candidatus Omnitrophica bacterium 4484_49]|nr:SsrA-binding protein SmpB [Candidatus Omnitrophota bacterium]OQX82500.1 MAG: SsrA-binding protein [Candidatus Omnitrophica bacterium 4484_49]RKY35888.1 MAG: SsrA-binding protein [Candidatus Omnitrophota bacterium]
MEKTVATNRKARRDYEIIYTLEAGISLLGSEVKSLRGAKANINDSFARIEEGEVYLYNCHISPYKFSSERNYTPIRKRKLLLHKNQIARLIGDVQRKGFTLIPLRIYFKDNKWAKVELALVKGKKLYDKREDLRKKAMDKEISKELKTRK